MRRNQGWFRAARRGAAVVAAMSALTVSSTAWAFPITSSRPWNSVRIFFERGFHVDGIVGMSNCSASFVRFKGVSDDAPGMVLTNGHCVGGGMFGGGMLQPGEVYYRKAKNFNLNLLDKSGSRIGTLSSRKIIYATMTDTDLAILELTQTYRQIQAATGVRPLEISTAAPAPGTPIEISSGYWNRTYTCQIEATIPLLREGGWSFRQSLRYSPNGCEVVGGTSGSPILSALTGEVIAINNTGNESGQRCTVNNPCEVAENGDVRVIPGRGYGQQTYWLYTCLNAQGVFDLAVPSCVLPKGGN